MATSASLWPRGDAHRHQNPKPFPRSLIRKLETSEFPLLCLAAIRERRPYLDAREDECISRVRGLGASPTDIAEAISMTRQSVYNRLRALRERTAEEPLVIPDLEPEPGA